MTRANEYIDAITATLADLRAEVHALREALYAEQQARERAERELAEMRKCDTHKIMHAEVAREVYGALRKEMAK